MSSKIRSRAIGAVVAALALAGTGVALVGSGSAQAATVTVVTGAGTGATDPTWTVKAPDPAAVAPATIITTAPSGWTAAITGAKWISNVVAPAAVPIGAYVFEAPVTAPAASTLAGSIASAVPLTIALVQGTTVTTLPGTFGGSATTPTPVAFAGPLAAGSWTIRVTATHADAVTPLGIVASFTLSDGVTEPEATQFYALPTPVRVYDSRTGTGSAATGAGPMVSGTTRTITLRQGYESPSATVKVAAVPADAVSALVNVTIDGTTAQGFLTVYSSAVAQPAASSINWSAAGQILANMNTVVVGADGIKITAGGGGTTQVIVDVLGFYR